VGPDPLRITNPTLGFRLDPGEPGMLRRGKASQATLLVTGQEHRNLVRLKSEAIREGRVVIHADTSYGRAFAGPYLTTTSGLTTVISRAPRPSVFESEAARRASSPPSPPPGGPEAGGAPSPALPETDDSSADEENRLRAELRRLESPGLGEPLDEPGGNAAEALRPLEEAAARRAEAARRGEVLAVEAELRRLRFGPRT
jgi:hypothetical protein